MRVRVTPGPPSFLRQIFDQHNVDVLLGFEIGLAHFELGGRDFLHAVHAQVDDRIRAALVDHPAEFLDGAEPVDAAAQYILNLVFGEIGIVFGTADQLLGNGGLGAVVEAVSRHVVLVVEQALIEESRTKGGRIAVRHLQRGIGGESCSQ